MEEQPPIQVKITDPNAPPPSGWAGLGAYVALTKPRIIELLLITTVPAMVLAEGGWPDTWLVIATLIGGTLSAGGANAINNYFDRDIDVVMRRTSHRPLPRDAIPASSALWFGIVLGVIGFLWLWLFVNLPAGLLATAALLFYVLVYTMALKRSTPQNIVIGGAAGAVPVLVGWAAVTGGLAPAAWLLFGIVFCWTPPHFWALAIRYKDDYASAGVPMLPVVVGEQRTTWYILGYSLLLTAVSLLLWPVAPTGALYPIAALILGALFVVEAARLIRTPERSMALFRYSTIYLAVLFAVIWVDTAIG
ncbi:MAG TPA: heme o synthase [Acidimicrobiia bacterium]|nr:heme o synthase [Acidimicrobiia bacterium]